MKHEKWWRRATDATIVWSMRSPIWRQLILWANIILGTLQSIRTRGWWPFLSTVAAAVAILFFGPLLLHPVVDFLQVIGVSGLDPAPEIGDWISLLNIALLTIAIAFVRWISAARKRVVVESFVDFTKDNATAVSGLSTLLVTELGRLRDLYHQIDDLSVPTAVGVERHGGFGRGKEAATFLTVSADDVTNVLEGAIASDARIEMGPARIPLGPVFAFFNRLTRGPRVTGSVHLTEAGGGPTLTAQLTGKESSGTWRVDQLREPESPEQRRAFLDSMVRELACRMFTQLTLRGSVRWEAVEAFNEYLRLYGDSRRTPHDRARFLKQAQSKLLEAVAEDERFDLAYYNLGVIYTQLAQTESVAKQQADDATAGVEFNRTNLNDARREAARVAFMRAAATNPERWEAYYAQAVTRFSHLKSAVEIHKPLEEGRGDLHSVIALCDQTLAVSPKKNAADGAVYDLRAMAQIRIGDDISAAFASQRKAVSHTWMEYCRACRRHAARPTGRPELTDRARANAIASLHNLALAYERRALLAHGKAGPSGRNDASRSYSSDLSDAEQTFCRAIRLAGKGKELAAASHFERGKVLERMGDFEKQGRGNGTVPRGDRAMSLYEEAADEFKNAGRIKPRSCEYRVSRARALAKDFAQRSSDGDADESWDAERKEKVTRILKRALALLANPFSLAVTPSAAETFGLECKATFVALKEAYEVLGDSAKAERIQQIASLLLRLQLLLLQLQEVSQEDAPPQDALLKELSDLQEKLREEERNREPRDWELDQVQLALGRAYADAGWWEEARETFNNLKGRLSNSERSDRDYEDLPDRIIRFGLYPYLARAERECGAERGRRARRESGQPKRGAPAESEEYVQALRTAAKGVRRDPLNVEGRREAGRAHFALGQFSDALAAWDHALWLSPSDPYLHYEVAMCHRRMAHNQVDEGERQRMIGCAESHFEQAQELFDGEDLNGEAWARFWRGRVAFEAGKIVEALAYFEGAEHGTATAAAALLVGEMHLQLEQRPAADHAFERCQAALNEEGKEKTTSRIKGRETIDALWGDELPEAAVGARIERGFAEAKYLAPGEWQGPKAVELAKERLDKAREKLRGLSDDDARDEATAKVLDTECKLLIAQGQIQTALDLTHQRLRYQPTPAALYLQAELLDLRVSQGEQISETDRLRLAADHAWDVVQSNGKSPRQHRRLGQWWYPTNR